MVILRIARALRKLVHSWGFGWGVGVRKQAQKQTEKHTHWVPCDRRFTLVTHSLVSVLHVPATQCKWPRVGFCSVAEQSLVQKDVRICYHVLVHVMPLPEGSNSHWLWSTCVESVEIFRASFWTLVKYFLQGRKCLISHEFGVRVDKTWQPCLGLHGTIPVPHSNSMTDSIVAL